MTERITVHPSSPERHNPVAEAAGERLKQLEHSPSSERKEAEQESIESIRERVEQEALKKESPSIAEHKTFDTDVDIPQQSRAMVYRKTMHQVQSEMTPIGRVFSRVIHTKAVEKASETVGSTVARPNAILSGSVCAFIAVITLYWLSKTYGFTLSGFETIGSFVIGWIFGLLFDFFKVMITGKRS